MHRRSQAVKAAEGGRRLSPVGSEGRQDFGN